MRNEHLSFRTDLLTKSLSYCFKEDCSVRNQCLHALAYKEDKDFCVASFLNPRMLQGNAQCPEFLSNKVEILGSGFKSALEQIPKGKITQVRAEIQRALGCCYTIYYRYMRGERLLNPKQAELVQDVFASYGLAPDQIFDSYVEAYVLN